MENDRFDALTRALSMPDSRRRTLRALGGTVLASVVARLGRGEVADAKARKHHKQGNDHNRSGGVQAAGKRHKKHKDKHKHKGKDKKPIPPLPPGCQHCTECQMCQDGTCVPDPALERVGCTGSGAACGYCRGGVCTASDIPPCDDGTCPHRGLCCPGEKLCSDPSLPTGFYCTVETACCDGQKKCGNQCVPLSSCCDAAPPECGRCDEVICSHGQYECITKCCADEKPCSGGACVARSACCPGEKRCDDECIPANQCCPGEAPPVCGECDVAVCQSGSWVCQPLSGCCPGGYAVCSGVPQGYFWHQGRWLGGCCPTERMIEGPACVQPWSGGSAWNCQ